MTFPKHINLELQHNEHAVLYETAQQWLESRGEHIPTFESDEEKARAIETNEIWMLQWYPDTPVGFHWIAAASLEALLKFAETFTE